MPRSPGPPSDPASPAEQLAPSEGSRGPAGGAIEIRGAREHNLKSVDISIPKRAITAITGPSGSGKTSLAIDTLGGESEYRLSILDPLTPAAQGTLRPAVSSVRNLPPLIVLDRRPLRTGSETVSSYLELGSMLFEMAKQQIRRPCPRCDGEIVSRPREEVSRALLSEHQGELAAVAAALSVSPETREPLIARLLASGYTRAIAAGRELDLDGSDPIPECSEIAVVIDRLTIASSDETRLAEALQQAAALEGAIELYSIGEEAAPRRLLGFSERGICERCAYMGARIEPELYDPRAARETRDAGGLSLAELDPYRGFGDDLRREILLQEIYGLALSEILGSESASVREMLMGRAGACERFAAALGWLAGLELGHLALARTLRSLSLGELQRVRLAKQLMLDMPGLGYVIDEPSVGLHPSDLASLTATFAKLRDRGHTLVLIDHSRPLLRASDHLVMMGPGPGALGGCVFAAGRSEDVACMLPRCKPLAPRSPEPSGKIRVTGADTNNLESISLEIPLGVIVGVCGVSGSGKTSLVIRWLVPRLRELLKNQKPVPGLEIEGPLGEVVLASYAGRASNPISIVATFAGMFDALRSLFAELPLSRARGYTRASFSLGTHPRSRRCESCSGSGRAGAGQTLGRERPCPACRGQRWESVLLDVRFKGFNLAEILELRASEARELLANQPECRRALDSMESLGLDYLCLGQSTGSLSDGELQRLRLARDLTKQRKGCLYIFEEPTSGLDPYQVSNLLACLRKLSETGNSVIATEHNLDFLQSADHIIELGPGAGARGGRVIYTGDSSGLLESNTPTGAAMAELGV